MPPQRGYSKKNLSRNLDLDLFAENGENGGSGIRKCLKPIWCSYEFAFVVEKMETGRRRRTAERGHFEENPKILKKVIY